MSSFSTEISRKLIAKNTLLNLMGYIAPLIAAVVCVPIIIRQIGTDRFGILTLIWSVLGYFNLFDLGLGRSIVHHLAKIGRSPSESTEEKIRSIIWTCLSLLSVLGLTGSFLVHQLTYPLIYKILNIPAHLRLETLQSLILVMATIPVVVLTSGLRGVLQTYQRFDLINIIQIPFGVLTFVGSVAVLNYSNSLYALVGVLVGLRLLVFIASLRYCFFILPFLDGKIVFHWKTMLSLINLGGWMTVSNLINPFLVYVDRFILGTVSSLEAVAYYTTPYEIVTKLWVIPGALCSVLFPTFSATYQTDLQRTARLYISGIKYTFIVIFPIVLIITTLGYEGLKIWIDAEFANNSTFILQWLAAGIFVNSIAQLTFNLLQGLGRPDLTAKAHLIELPFYLIIMWYLIKNYGAKGAAMAWFGRVTVDSFILHFIATKHIPIPKRTDVMIMTILLMTLSLFIIGAQIVYLTTKIYFLVITLAIFALTIWKLLLNERDKNWLKNKFKNLRGP